MERSMQKMAYVLFDLMYLDHLKWLMLVDRCRELKKIISKDSHIGVVSEAVACTGALAKGLRKEYSSNARIFVTVLLDKFKDKNTICVNNVAESLGYMHM